LYLSGTRVTDRGLPDLALLKGLETLDLSMTGVTSAAIKELATALPQCKIKR
jgi:hypothetical protein